MHTIGELGSSSFLMSHYYVVYSLDQEFIKAISFRKEAL